MTTMYDSVTPSAIPRNALIVAGYIDGHYAWTAADWALFPKAEKVRIAVFASTDDGRVLDVETGDATPAEAPVWVAMRRRSTAHPLTGPATVYCNASTWPSVRAAFVAAKVAEPDYWIADYDNVAVIPAGAVAKQYQSLTSPNVDISITVASWPVAPAPPKPPAPKPKPTPVPTPTEDDVKSQDVSVKIAASGEGTTTVAIPFAKVIAATSLAGAGANDCGHASIASSGTSTVVTVRDAKAGTTQDVRITSVD